MIQKSTINQTGLNIICNYHWPEIVSAISTFVGVGVAIWTVWKWRSSKINDDTYQSAKLYITALHEAELNLKEIISNYYYILPRVGAVFLGKELIQQRLNHSAELQLQLENL